MKTLEVKKAEKFWGQKSKVKIFLVFYNKNRSGKIHFQFHNKPTSFTGHKMFKKDPEEYVKIPGMTIPIGVVLQQAFEE